jgi:WD40 repeat protein/tRNA A-37 threonylcarbamoyl transferase component Bud32
VLGGFELREQIGEGGFAIVYRAYQMALDREAVVKVLHARLANRADVTQRFLRESRLASRLDHPYAAHVYAFGAEPDGTLWIAMEIVRGMPMDKLLEEQGALPLDRFVPLFERICEVVQTAHERGIVHRDIKPGNVMVLSRAGRLLPKLLDFGIARVVEDTSIREQAAVVVVGDASVAATNDTLTGTEQTGRATSAGSVIGSPRYMAPEQWSDAGSVGQAADIYALGIVAFEALTGRLPFEAATVQQAMYAHATEAPPSLGNGLEALDPVIARALAKRPEDRYATAGDLAAAIRAATGRGDADVLPELEEAIRVAMSAGAPQPLAEAVAALETARNIDQACALVWDAVAVASHWLGALALAARSKIGSGGDSDDRDAAERLRALGRGDIDDQGWIDLARALTRPFRRRRDAYPIPELVGLFHGDLAETPPDGIAIAAIKPAFLDSFAQLRTLHGTLDRRAGKTDEQRRELYAEALVALADLLRTLRFLLDYTVIVTRRKRAERWRGLRRSPRPAIVRRARPLPDDDAYLLDVDGQPVLALSPLVQAATPAPGKDEELFVFAGHGPHGGRLVAMPYGFELHDDRLGDWLREHVLEVADDQADKPADELVPYRGLAAFTTADAGLYFGREREVDTMVNRLRVEAFLAVVGPSGAGKSSFVQAGIVPRLPTSWRAIILRPGGTPAAALAARLEREGIDATGIVDDPRALGDRLRAAAARDGSTIVLVVDQLEELFTLCRIPEQRARFAEALADAARSDDDPVRVIVTLRDDFLIRAEGEGPLRERLARGMKLLTTPAAEDLERILTEPARRVGYQFEDRGLVTEMVEAVAGQPGALALLSFTAAELWKLRDRHFHQLGRKAYVAIGGVGGALARHAEATFANMSSEQHAMTREAFRRLVTAEGTRAVLTRVELVQVLGGTSKADQVIEMLVAARLLATSEAEQGEQIEVIHEALLSAWPRLVDWRHEDVEGARMRDQLRAAARQWEDRGRPTGLLWRGDALAEFQIWRGRAPGSLTVVEEAFTTTAVHEAARGKRLRRTLLIGAFGFLIVALAAAVLLINRIANQREELATNLQRQYEDQGRRRLLERDPLQALAFLAKSAELGASGPAHDFLVAQAVRASDGEVLEMKTELDILTAQFSSDGTKLITGGFDRRPRIWDTSTGKRLLELPQQELTVWFARFAPDDRTALTGSSDGMATLWAMPGGQRLHQFRHTARIRCALYTPDGKLAITASDDDTVAIWELPSGRSRARLHGDGAGMRTCDVSSDGTTVAAGDARGAVWVWDLRDGRLVHTLRDAQTGAASFVRFRTDASRLVSGGAEGVVAWDLDTGGLAFRLATEGQVNSLELSADGKQIVTSSSEKTAHVWNAETGARLHALAGHATAITDARFSPDGKYIVTSSYDGSAWLWNASDARVVARWHGHQDSIHKVAFDAKSERVVTVGADGKAIVWRVAPQEKTVKLAGSKAPLAMASFSPDGGSVVTAAYDGKVRLWDARTGRERVVIAAHEGAALAAFRPDGRELVTAGGNDGAVLIWDASGTARRTLSSRGSEVSEVTWSPDGKLIAAASQDGRLRCWDAATGALRFENQQSKYVLRTVAFNATSTSIVAAGDDAEIRVWNVDGTLARTYIDPERGMHPHAELDRDSSRLLIVSAKQIAKIVRLDGSEPPIRLVGHVGKIGYGAWSPDEALVITAAIDGTARLWDAARGDQLAIFEHPGWVQMATFSPDGRRVVLAGIDGTAMIHDLPSYTATRAELAKLLRCRVPYVVRGDRLEPRERDEADCVGILP